MTCIGCNDHLFQPNNHLEVDCYIPIDLLNLFAFVTSMAMQLSPSPIFSECPQGYHQRPEAYFIAHNVSKVGIQICDLSLFPFNR